VRPGPLCGDRAPSVGGTLFDRWVVRERPPVSLDCPCLEIGLQVLASDRAALPPKGRCCSRSSLLYMSGRGCNAESAIKGYEGSPKWGKVCVAFVVCHFGVVHVVRSPSSIEDVLRTMGSWFCPRCKFPLSL